MKILPYLRSRLKSIALFFISIIISALVCALYSLPIDAVLYAAVLIFVVAIAFAVVDFCQCRSRHKTLMLMLKSIDNLSDITYECVSPIENDYIQIIKAMIEQRRRIVTEHAGEITKMTDYYNVWAHQIKTPIAAMQLLLQNDENSSELYEQLFKIEQYVDMVLNYLRSSAASNDYVIMKYSLDEIIRSTVKKYSGSFIRKQLSLKFEDTNLSVYTDAKWIEFVIGQLIQNALKYTTNGSISIYSKENELVIEDTGIGIAAEDLPRVFENGYTGYNGREDKKSTGIGLYLCRRVLKKLSHDIYIESQQGKGTQVHIVFNNQLEIVE